MTQRSGRTAEEILVDIPPIVDVYPVDGEKYQRYPKSDVMRQLFSAICSEVIDTRLITVADGSGDVENGEVTSGNFETLRAVQRQKLATFFNQEQPK